MTAPLTARRMAEAAQAFLATLDAFARRTSALASVDSDAGTLEAFRGHMDDDLDTPRALKVLRAAVRRRDAAAARWMAGIICGDAALR